MPSIFHHGPYRFFFYSGDRDEPIHVHVERDDSIAKVWIKPVRLQTTDGFSRPEIIRILKIIAENQDIIVEAWNDFFGN